jgi:hypothetical protein
LKKSSERGTNVRLLSSSSGSVSTELLGLHSSGVGDEEGSVVGDKGLLDVDGRGGVDVLGVELVAVQAGKMT